MKPKEVGEIERWIEQIKKSYWEMLTYREGIQSQILLEEERLKNLKNQRKEINLDIASSVSSEFKERKKTKDDNQGIIDDIVNKQKALASKENQILNAELGLVLKEGNLEEIKKNLEAQKHEINKKIIEADQMVKRAEEIILDSEKRRQAANQAVEESMRFITQAEEFEDSRLKIIGELRIKGQELDFREEELKKQKEVLESQKEAQEKEARHIDSQNEALKLSFDELRKLRK